MAEGDQFATLCSAALQDAASAAMAIVEDGAGRALGGLSGGALAFFETLAERNDEAIRAFRLNAVQDEVSNLRNELRALVRRLAAEGKAPDRQDPMSQTAVASEFVRNIAVAQTVEKRTALVHATVHQFDPRKGSPSTRDYWLRRVRDLPEAELAFLLLVAEKRVGFFLDRFVEIPKVSPGGGNVPVTVLQLPLATIIAHQTIATHMARVDTGRLIENDVAVPTVVDGANTWVSALQLTASGRVLVSFCRED